MRAYMKFVTVLALSLVNWYAYTMFARNIGSVFAALSFIFLGSAITKLLLDLALKILTDQILGIETSTKTGLGEKPVRNFVKNPEMEPWTEEDHYTRYEWNPNTQKEEVKKVPVQKPVNLANLYPKWNCPKCNDWFHMPYKYCKCGQNVDWSQVSERKPAMNVVADPLVADNEILLLNPVTNEIIARVYNVKVGQK